MLYRDDIKYWLSVVKLLYNLGSNRLQPCCQNKIMRKIDITHILHLIHLIHLIHNNHFHDCSMFPSLTQVHSPRTWSLGPNVCFSRGWEQEQYLIIPNYFKRQNKCSIINSPTYEEGLLSEKKIGMICIFRIIVNYWYNNITIFSRWILPRHNFWFLVLKCKIFSLFMTYSVLLWLYWFWITCTNSSKFELEYYCCIPVLKVPLAND